MKIIIKYFVYFGIIAISYFSCAAIGPAGGGPSDSIGPVLIDISPMNGATNLSKNQKITLTFSEPLDPNSVQAAIKINIENNISMAVKKNIVTITPIGFYDENKVIRINIDRAIRDYQGNIMESPISLIYSTSSIPYNGKIYGKLANINTNEIYEVGLYNFPGHDSLKLLLKTQTNEHGEFYFNFIKSENYIIIATEGKIENIYEEIKFSKYGINPIDYLEIDSNFDSLYTEIYIDKPLPRLDIKAGKLLGNNFGKIYYSDGTEDNFFFSIEDEYIFPQYLKVSKMENDSLKIKSNLQNRLTSYYTNNFYLNYSSFPDTVQPNIINHRFDKLDYQLSFSEPIFLNSSKNKGMYCLNPDSSFEYLVFDKSNPFIISIYNINNIFNTIYIEPGLIIDEAGNSFPDSLFIISINESNSNNIYDQDISGKLSGNILNFDLDVIVEANNIETNISKYTKSYQNEYIFDDLKPGKYKLKAFEILNNKNDTIYYSGTINPYHRAAKFSIYPENIDIRGRWEINGINIKF